MKQFYSLSKHPGTTGERYFNTFFKKYKLPYNYTALKCEDIKDGVTSMRECAAEGFSVSMPFKSEVIKEVDFIENIVAHYNSCNTVVLRPNGNLYGYNTDYAGALSIISEIPKPSNIAILGDGAMGSMFKKILGAATVYSRKSGNWDERYSANDVVINCTSFGTSVSDSPFDKLPKANLVIDLAIKPNQLEEQAKSAGVKYIGGIEFYKRQFIRQFGIYTQYQIKLSDLDNI